MTLLGLSEATWTGSSRSSRSVRRKILRSSSPRAVRGRAATCQNSGAVAHADERFERALDVAVRRPPVLLHVGDDGAGVVLALVVRPAGLRARAGGRARAVPAET